MILTVAGILVKLIGAASKIVVSRLLGGEGIGLYQIAYPIYQLAVSIAAAGLPVAISLMIAEKLADRDMRGVMKIFKVSSVLLSVAGIFFAVLLYIGAEVLIAEHVIVDARAYTAIVALIPAMLLVTLLSSLRGYFQGFQYMVPTAVSQIFEQIFRVGGMVLVVMLLLPEGIEYAAAGATFSTFFGIAAGLAVLLFFFVRQSGVRRNLMAEQSPDVIPETSAAVAKRLCMLAIPVSLAGIMIPIVSATDMLIVPRRLLVAGYSVGSATELFGYLTGMATSLVNFPTILTASLATGLVPAVSEAVALRDFDAVRRRTATAMRIACFITIPSFAGLCILEEPVSEMLYATPAAGTSVAILSLSIFLLGVQQVTTGILQGTGHAALPMVNLAAALVVKIALGWYLTALPSWGIAGAAWATNADFAAAAALNLYFVHRYVGYRIDVGALAKISAASVCMAAAAFCTYRYVSAGFGNTEAVLAAIAVAVPVYAGLSALFGVIAKDDVKHLRRKKGGA